MLHFIICLLAIGAEVSATTPRRPPPGCPFPSGPYVPPDCGPNAYFEVCSYPCPLQNCSTLWTNYKCKEECCRPECRCKDGFLRDDKSGLCVRRDECFSRCGPLEHFVRGSTKCQRTCANYKVTGPQSMCKPFTGCACKDGRVRLYDDATGPCVLPSQCPKRRCPLHEHFEDCPSICAKETCISKSPDYKCLLPAIPLPCKPRCICDKGYLRDHFGHCVPEKHCPIKKCPPNEVWRCASPCAQDSCKRQEPGFKCPPGVSSVCLPACTCKDGYLRNDLGFCIPKELCPASLRCGINEVAVECATVWPQTCESVYTEYKPVDVPCNPGCDCRPGYLRNRRNICVPSAFCPAVPYNECGPNQEYLKCGSSCAPTCASLDVSGTACSDECVAGCFCKQGYYKDERGNCVTREECPLPVCPRPNEVAKDCGSYCEIKTCEDYKRTDISCPAVCVRGCFCRDGYVRNAYGICVLPEQCPPEPVCLQENEEYQSCGSSCPDNCDNYDDTERICTANCVAGCNCKLGYVRNLRDNTCVKPEQCPDDECTGVNEEWNLCSSYCPVTCANRFTLGDWACITLCREGCDCIPGTLRNDNGTCVPVEQCTPPVCRENEKYMKCGTACPLTCDNYKSPPACTEQCVEDCFCQDGYVRDRNMRCVKPEHCEPICPLGEKWNECSAHCQDTCENYNNPNRSCTYQCQSGCVCEAGTVRRNDGQCVPTSECSGPTCRDDEIFDPCSAHCEPTCDHHEPNRPCTTICKPGCRCCDGLVRQNDGTCVKLEECKPDCPAGETFSPCSAHCQDTCENYNIPNRPCTRQCQPGCVCNAGTVRRKDGQCVPSHQCSDPRCRDDEIFDECSAHCEPTCDHHEPNRPCTAICKPGCRCRNGLVRKNDGTCVELEQCSSQACSDPNAERVECGLATACRPTCAHPNPGPCLDQCVPNACVCKPGFLLSEPGGECIRPDYCYALIPCNGDPNARVKECPMSCPATCAAPIAKPCPKSCEPFGCECRNGYLLSEINGKCIYPEQCPGGNPCNSTEMFVPCKVNCADDFCPTSKSPNTAECVKPVPCYPGCRCKFNYLLRSVEDQRCIYAPDCPPIQCGENEVWSGCPNPCLAEECWNVGDASLPCASEKCNPGCICKDGYYRENTTEHKCIPANQCPPRLCGLNEHYEKDSYKCQFSCSDYHLEPVAGPCAAFSGCYCDGNMVRDNDGQCIKREECPKCGPHEHYEINRNKCEQTCDNYKLESAIGPCQTVSGCFCDFGFVRDYKGQCVAKDQCSHSAKCGPNEHYEEVSTKCQLTCSNYHLEPLMGPCASTRACFCDGNMVRDADGKCVKREECPLPVCPRPNEVAKDCGSYCEIKTCEDYKRTDISCPAVCVRGCFCLDGYVRNAYGICVLPRECPHSAKCGPNEHYEEVSTKCQLTCSNYHLEPVIGACASTRACFCDGNMVRDADGKCIKREECQLQYQQTTNKCGPNQEYLKCGSSCAPTCASLDVSGTACSDQCVAGCFCKPGYYKDGRGNCVTREECPLPVCPRPNEVAKDCGSYCEMKTCENYKRTNISCAAVCVRGCFCLDGYVRNAYGICVLPEQCPHSAKCGPNEHYEEVSTKCQLTCSNYHLEPVIGACASTRACFCDGNMVRDADGKCVKREDCQVQYQQTTNKCGPKQEYLKCGSSCAPTCASLDVSGTACSDQCVAGCFCKPGYYKDGRGNCVTREECPLPVCPRPNEVAKDCGSYCEMKTCENYKRTNISCAAVCVRGCFCLDGYVRNAYGICVLPEQCPHSARCGPNEHYEQVSTKCQLTCSNYHLEPVIGACASTGACFCDGNMVRDADGKCVKREDCQVQYQQTTNKCGPKQEYLKCGSSCAPTCASLDVSGTACSDQCVAGCFCKPGYYKDGRGNCVTREECPLPVCPRPNEVAKDCGSYCEMKTCENYKRTNISCAAVCVRGCFCLDGYVRNAYGICVLPEQCPHSARCGPNEHYEEVSTKCQLTCSNYHLEPVIGACASTGACFCDGNMVRDANGKCVKREECPKRIICPRNEVLSNCYNSCHMTCKTRLRSDGRICHTACIESGCLCIEGYLRHDNGTCVPTSQCSPPVCWANETYSNCGSSCPDTCRNRGDTCRVCTQQCVEDCFCSAGLVRADDGTCVAPQHCPPRTCSDPNEVFDECPPTCPPTDNCSEMLARYDCSKFPKCCKPQCRCRSGYARNKKGVCVTTQQCFGGQ